MREYHPLDVRHPSNRDLLSRNYLLDPPSPDAGADKIAPSRRAPAASGHREARQPSAPWGRRQTTAAPTAPTAPTGQSRKTGGGFWWNATIALVFVIIFGSQNGWFDGLFDMLRLLARQNGVTLPF